MSRLFPTKPNASLIRSLVAASKMAAETETGKKIGNAVKGAGSAAIAGVVGAPNAIKSSLDDMNKKNRQQYNREQSQRSAGRYQKKETPDEYNRRKAEEIVNGKPDNKSKGKYNNSPELVRRMGVHHNANKIKERGYNRG